MESSYGIGIKNRYELFYDDESDPHEMVKGPQQKKKDKNSEKENKTKVEKGKDNNKKPEKANSTAKVTEKSVSQGNTVEKEKKDVAVSKKTGERVRFADREERNNRNNTENKDSKEINSSRYNGDVKGKGRSNGYSSNENGRGRGQRRGKGTWSESRGKREFDRQSGMVTSGVKPVDKKDGAGSYNWGTDKDVRYYEGSDAHGNSDSDSGDKDKGKEPGSGKENDSPKEEESPKEMTLDEWKASQKRDKPQFNLRKAGEGENTSQWKVSYVLKKKEETAAVTEDVPEETENGTNQGKRKVLIPIDFQFADAPSRGRYRGRGRGGPGAGRGRGRGGSRGGGRFPPVSRQEAPKMDNEIDFPSLA